MITLSVSIMAHPRREKMVNQLIEVLGETVPVSWDVGAPSVNPEKRWANGVNAWRLRDPQADWHLVLQDDAIPAPGLLSALRDGLEHVPGDGPVSLYLGTKRPSPHKVTAMAKRAADAGASWIGLPFLGWGVGFAVPAVHIDPMIRVASSMKRLPYDTRIGRYFRHTAKTMVWYTWPCLVDHDPGRSLLGHGGSGRHAVQHATTATGLDWLGPVVTM